MYLSNRCKNYTKLEYFKIVISFDDCHLLNNLGKL